MIKKVFFMFFVMMALLCAFACSEEDKTDDNKKDQTEQPSDNLEEPSDEPKVKEYTVKFVDGDLETVQTVKEGEKVVKPADPEKVGYVFKGWYVGNDAYDFEKVITGDLELVAKFEEEKEEVKDYTVKFVIDGEDSEVKVAEGEKAIKPIDPEKVGYVFKGWYVDDEEYNFEVLVSTDLELTAKFEEETKEYTVKFVVDGASEVVTVKEGEKAVKPIDPEKEGYIFVGWFAGADEYDFETYVTSDLELIAKFEEKIIVPEKIILSPIKYGTVGYTFQYIIEVEPEGACKDVFLEALDDEMLGYNPETDQYYFKKAGKTKFRAISLVDNNVKSEYVDLWIPTGIDRFGQEFEQEEINILVPKNILEYYTKTGYYVNDAIEWIEELYDTKINFVTEDTNCQFMVVSNYEIESLVKEGKIADLNMYLYDPFYGCYDDLVSNDNSNFYEYLLDMTYVDDKL